MNELGQYRVLAGPTRVLVEIAAEAGHRLQLISDNGAGTVRSGAAVDAAEDGGPVLLELGDLPDAACTLPLAVRIWPAGQELQSRLAGIGEATLPDVLSLFANVTATPQDVAAFRTAMAAVLAKYIPVETLGAAIAEFVGEVRRLNTEKITRETAAALAEQQAVLKKREAETIRLIG